VAKLGPSLDAQTINEQKLFDNSLTCIKKLLIGPSAIGFNRRKLEDQRRKPAEEEAADIDHNGHQPRVCSARERRDGRARQNVHCRFIFERQKSGQ
jgi:hypothetical protein